MMPERDPSRRFVPRTTWQPSTPSRPSASQVAERSAPSRLKPGEKVKVRIDSEEAFLIGAHPDGHVATLAPEQMRRLSALLYGRLTFNAVDGLRVSAGTGHSEIAVKFFNDLYPDHSKHIHFKNVQSLDIRPSNVVVLNKDNDRTPTINQRTNKP